jgi:hypothetical protein
MVYTLGCRRGGFADAVEGVVCGRSARPVYQ